ncbi:MAG: LamG domain-containing protein [Nitrospira sp.]|nr:LamG domain-containing protein [Nitrospira sp.]
MQTGLIERFTLPRWPFQLNYQSEQAKLLTAWYPVLPWEHDAKLADLTASARHITSVTGTPVLSAADLRHSVALAFDGSSNYVQFGTVSTFISASAGAFACWVRPMLSSYDIGSPAYELNGILADNGGYMGLVIGDIGGTTGQKIHAFNYTGSTNTVSALATFEQYRWYHVVWAHSGGTLSLYIDGVLQGSVASGDSTVSNSLRAGNGYGGYANVEIADIRYYSDRPSDAAIWQMYSPATRWDLYARPHARSMECFGIVPGGSTIDERDGTAAGTGTATGISADLEARAGTSAGAGAATGQAGAIQGRQASAGGQGAATGASAAIAGTAATSAGSLEADVDSAQIQGRAGTSTGAGAADGQAQDVGGGVDGSASGQATVTGSASAIQGRSGTSAGTADAEAAMAAIVSLAATSGGTGLASAEIAKIVARLSDMSAQAVAQAQVSVISSRAGVSAGEAQAIIAAARLWLVDGTATGAAGMHGVTETEGDEAIHRLVHVEALVGLRVPCDVTVARTLAHEVLI